MTGLQQEAIEKLDEEFRRMEYEVAGALESLGHATDIYDELKLSKSMDTWKPSAIEELEKKADGVADQFKQIALKLNAMKFNRAERRKIVLEASSTNANAPQ